MKVGPSHLRRRDFLGRATAVAAATFAASGAPALARAKTASGTRIRRIRSFRIVSRRWKVVGKNSRRDVHGNKTSEHLLVIDTTAGTRGLGWSSAGKEEAARLLGKDPLEFFVPGVGVLSPLGRKDAPLWDLVGKVLEQPAWRLFGGYGPEWVPVYDGSIYFSDLQPEHAGRGIDRLREEVDHALEQGHRAFKIKVGRGAKWMEKEAGLKRDVEVVRALRKHTGKDVKLMVDANNGYDLATTKRFLDEADQAFHFVEEMFPETVAETRELQAWLRERGMDTLVADGESAGTVEHFEPFVQERALDVLQGDMRRFGFTEILRLARLAAPAGVLLAPHNWGSYLGGYMQVILGRGIPNVCIAEFDPAQNDLFDTSAFELKDGRMRAPDAPGCALVLKDEKLGEHTLEWEVA